MIHLLQLMSLQRLFLQLQYSFLLPFLLLLDSAGATSSHLADTSSSQSSSLPGDIAKSKNEKPAQSECMMYPIHTCGTVKRSFSPAGIVHIPGLNVECDSVYCFPCCFFGSNHDTKLVKLDNLTGSMLWESEGHSPFMTPLANTEKQFCLGRTTSQPLLLTLQSPTN